MFGRRLSPEHETIVLKHQLKEESIERNLAARAEQKERELRAKALADRQKADAARNAAIEKQHAERERAWYSRPETEYVGGNNTSPDTFFVKHYASPLPVAALPHPADGEYRQAPVWFAPGLMKYRNGDLQGDQSWMEQARETKKVWDEIADRYTAILGKLRDAEWWQRLCEDAGVTRSDKPVDFDWHGNYAAGTYKLTTIHVPTIRSVRVAEDGLRIIVRRDGDAARDWVSKLDYLRAGFKSGGMNAAHLRITETVSGDIELIFDDSPASFPLAVAPPPVQPVSSVAEAVKRYPSLTWQLGVDSRGKVISPLLRKFPHVLVAGSTGGGKSVWIRSMIEALRVQGCAIWLVDGKRSDYVALAELPGVRMVSTEPEQHVIAVSEVYEEMEHRRVTASAAKAAGDPDPYSKFPPVVLVLDEFATVRDEWRAIGKRAKGGDENVIAQIAALLRVGRETRCHLVIASQDIYVENIPQNWQDNLSLFVSLGAPSPRTLSGGAIPESLRPDAQRIGERISRDTPGRSVYIDRAAFTVREVQSFYGYSPGTTPPTAAPTAEVKAAWEESERIAAQVPWLYPRVGIKATSSEWREQNLIELAEQETVALTDRNGIVKPELERYDPLRVDWLGAAAKSGRKRRAPSTFDDEPSAVPVPTEPEPPAGASTPDPLDGVSPEELAAALALIKKSRVTDNEPSTAPRSAQPAADPGGSPDAPSGAPSRKPQGTTEPTPDQEEDDGW